jgi:chemotaxis protein methyltransferase CheR
MVNSVKVADRSRSGTVESIELELLLEGIYQHLGDDFRGYDHAALGLKLNAFMAQHKVMTFSALQDRVLHEKSVAEALIRTLYECRSAMFEDAGYQQALRQVVLRDLRSWPDPNVWLPECRNVEDIFSIAILLEEEGLYAKSRIFVTSPNRSQLTETMAGGFPIERMQEYEENYRLSGGKNKLASYGQSGKQKFVFAPGLSRNIVWSQSDLTTDASFNEFQLVVCRNAMKDFGSALRRRSLELFDESLSSFGILSVDPVNEPDLHAISGRYKSIEPSLGLYRRLG